MKKPFTVEVSILLYILSCMIGWRESSAVFLLSRQAGRKRHVQLFKVSIIKYKRTTFNTIHQIIAKCRVNKVRLRHYIWSAKDASAEHFSPPKKIVYLGGSGNLRSMLGSNPCLTTSQAQNIFKLESVLFNIRQNFFGKLTCFLGSS